MATFEIKSPSGEVFEVNAPDDATEQQVLQYAQEQFAQMSKPEQKNPEQEMSAGKEALRAAEFGSRGFLESAAESIGAIPELAASGLRAINPSLAPEKGYYPEVIKEGVSKFGRAISSPVNALVDFGPDEPQSTLERGAYGAGRGAADAAAFMVPGMAAAKLGQGVTKGVGQMMASQPAMQAAAGAAAGGVSDAADSELAGLAAGLATPVIPAMVRGAVSRAVTPFASQLGKEEARLARAAEDIGIQLTPGQKTGSPSLQTMESSFAQLPFTAKPQGEIYDAQRKAFNRAVLSKAGISGDEVTPQVVDDAYKAIGKEFDQLADATTLRIDQRFLDDINLVSNEYGRRLPTDVAPVFKSYMDDLGILQKEIANKPEIAGREYQKLSSNIKKRARSAANNPDLQQALNSLAGALDDVVMRSGGPDLRNAWQDVRRRYKNLLTIDKAAQGGTQSSRAGGDVAFNALRQAVKQMDKRGYARGRGDLNELSRVGDFLGAAIPPDSGTARRSLIQGLMTGTAGGGAGTMAVMGDPVTAAALGAGAMLGPKAAQLAYQTPVMQRYLSNQAMPRQPGRLTADLLGKIAIAQQTGQLTE